MACRDTGEFLILQSNAWAMLGSTYEQKGNLRLNLSRSQHKFCFNKRSAHSKAGGTLTTKKNSGTLHKSHGALKGNEAILCSFKWPDALAVSAPVSHVSSNALLPAPVAGYVQWSQCKAMGKQGRLWPRGVHTAACICPRN